MFFKRRRLCSVALGSIPINTLNQRGAFKTTIITRLTDAALIQLIRVNHYGYCGQRHIQIALASAAATDGAARGTAMAAKLRGKVDFERRANETSPVAL